MQARKTCEESRFILPARLGGGTEAQPLILTSHRCAAGAVWSEFVPNAAMRGSVSMWFILTYIHRVQGELGYQQY